MIKSDAIEKKKWKSYDTKKSNNLSWQRRVNFMKMNKSMILLMKQVA